MQNVDLDKFYEMMGARIKAARSKSEINQDALAEYLDLTRTSISNIETGRQRPAIHLLIQISRILKMSLLDLIPDLYDDELVLLDFKHLNKNEILSDSAINKTTEKSFLDFWNTVNLNSKK